MSLSEAGRRLCRRKLLKIAATGSGLTVLRGHHARTAAGASRSGVSPRVLRARERRAGGPGKEVILGRSDELYPRHSEGDLVELADGSLLAVWERHSGPSDHDSAVIVGRRSRDAGETWSDLETLANLSEPEHRANSNLMSASLLRLRGSPRVLLTYLGKEETGEDTKQFNRKIRCAVYARWTTDGKKFSRPARITDRDHYYVVNNARTLQLRTGRILVPAAASLDPGKELGWEKQACVTFFSDDLGATWRQGQPCLLRQEDLPGVPYRNLTLQEPGLIELEQGRVFMVIRTRLGHPYKSLSSDGGETWSAPEPISELVTPSSPQTLFRLPKSGRICLVYNNNPLGAQGRFEDRRPLSFAVSTDEGATFGFRKVIQDLPARTFDYVSVRIYGDRVYLAYREWQIGNYPVLFLTDFKLLIIPASWFED